MMTKEKEIQLLKELKGDTYFSEVFKPNVIDAMCENIRADHPIDCGIEIFKNSHEAMTAKNEAKRLNEELNKLKKAYESMLIFKDKILGFLIKSASECAYIETEKELLAKAEQIVGRKEVIRKKLAMKLTLSPEDSKWLLENL